MRTYAFIDGQNLHIEMQRLGWQLDYSKFCAFLTRTYHVSRALYFIGYRADQLRLYARLRGVGFELRFKEVIRRQDGSWKGNCDSDLICAAWELEHEYDLAVIVSSDGDFAPLVRLLRSRRKFRDVLTVRRATASKLLKDAAGSFFTTIGQLRELLERKKT